MQMPVNNPYQQQMNYMQPYSAYQYNPLGQQYQQQNNYLPKQQAINGKYIQSADMITANDVPMDGSVAFFPTTDLKEIYVKGWDGNGKISTIVFKPDGVSRSLTETEKLKFDLSGSATEVFEKKFNALFERIDQLESKIDKNSARATSRSKTANGGEEK